MPMAAYVTDPAKSKAYLAATAEYKFKHHITGLVRRCPECGGELPKRKRFCAECSKKHRRSRVRQAVQRFRQSDVIS
jgi:hypothetical protein